MKTIKFRAWNGIEMYYTHKNDQSVFVLSLNCWELGEADYEWCVWGASSKDNHLLMQFTGLTDKNGKEIYEGDIVTYKRSIGNWTGQFMTTTHEIVFNDEVFAFVMEYGNSYIKLRKHWGYEYEVIGNIYENSEIELKN